MKNDNVFSFNDYKQYLLTQVKSENSRGELSRLALVAGCQVSYLSRVISSKIQLTPDQGYRLCNHWGFSNLERRYFMILLDLDRAADKEYKEHLKLQLKNLKSEFNKISEKVKGRVLSKEESHIFYHSNWTWSAVHFLTSIPQFQTPQAIGARLNLPVSQTEFILNHLEQIGYVARSQTKWIYKSGGGHLSKDSPLLSYYHHNWRNRALLDSQNPETDGLHFTSLHTISRRDVERIKDILLKTIQETSEIAAPSSSEELVCFACDFFRC